MFAAGNSFMAGRGALDGVGREAQSFPRLAPTERVVALFDIKLFRANLRRGRRPSRRLVRQMAHRN
jgi:hypothetical protein